MGRARDVGQKFGRFSTREEAELAAQAIVQRREAELVIHLPDGRTQRKSLGGESPLRMIRHGLT
ncbi:MULTISPECIES: DUF2188 domain-containing protein [Bradyrhizobium]|uniref:DUF2188 domain-containing protein n=1 Tax=Bradyrhizobium TaxID=374 RepID=UPI0038576782